MTPPEGTVIRSEQDPSGDTPPAGSTSDPPQGEPEGTPNPSETGRTDEPDLPSYATREYLTALEEQLREQNRTIQTLAERQTMPQPQNQPATEPEYTDEDRERFYRTPHAEVRSIIKQELDNSIAPLRDFVQTFRQGNAYTELKNRFKVEVTFRQLGQHLNDPDIEAAVDQIMAKAEPTDVNMQQAIIHAVGLKHAGVLTASTAQPAIRDQHQPTNTQPADPNTQPQGGRTVPQPAHMRPSNPNPPRPSTPQRRQLNELERRIARERNMTDEQYLNWLELPAADVVRAERDTGKVAAK